MNKTIYIRDEDVPVWDRARELAGEKLSPVIVEGLKRFVAEKEAASKGFGRIEVEFEDSEDNNIPKIHAFYGRWIFSPSEPFEDTAYGDGGEPIATTFAVAETAKGNWVVLLTRSFEDFVGPRRTQSFNVFGSPKVAADFPSMNLAIREALKKRGLQVEELDI